MGLDTSHGCWHGAYSAFHRWRCKLAEVAGFPPLQLMDGFFDPQEFWCSPPGVGRLLRPTDPPERDGPLHVWSHAMEQAFARLPITWDRFEHDPLSKLLHHSDCNGIIEAADCGPIADRLADLLPLLPPGEGGGHIGDWRAKTQAFINGLRKAAAAGEDVEFH
jgi:hypothetical protein